MVQLASSNSRMTEAAYQRERDEIRERYGESTVEAGAIRDQALAVLFYRSGWTQEQLSKVEGCKKSVIAYRLTFGRFLSFSTTGGNPVILPRNLSERRFRSYWEQTDKTGNERIRFRAVLDLMTPQTTLSKSHATKKGVASAILDHFADGAWHKLPTIAAHVKAPVEDVVSVLDLMQKKGTYSSHCERKQVGTQTAFKIVRKSKTIDVGVLMQELRPILDGLAAEGKKNMATASPSTVAYLAHQLESLIEKLAK